MKHHARVKITSGLFMELMGFPPDTELLDIRPIGHFYGRLDIEVELDHPGLNPVADDLRPADYPEALPLTRRSEYGRMQFISWGQK